jgi:hypothetical protein
MIVASTKPLSEVEGGHNLDSTKLLIGSLSNDLYRAATLMGRGANKGAERFLMEAGKWVEDLKGHKVKGYIKKIVSDLRSNPPETPYNFDLAEKYLMYSILLQNYALHYQDK